MTCGLTFEERADEVRCVLRVNGIAVGAQLSHAAGIPISQRACPGLNWPPPSISAKEPVRNSPEAVNRAGPSSTVQFVSSAMSLRVTCTFFPSGVRPVGVVPSGIVCPPEGVVAVGHPARSDPSRRLGDLPTRKSSDRFLLLAIGVPHPSNEGGGAIRPVRSHCGMVQGDVPGREIPRRMTTRIH